MKSLINPTALFCALQFGLTCFASPLAVGETIPYTNALVFSFNPTGSPLIQQTFSDPPNAATASYSVSGEWGSAGGYAYSNLATGQLKVSAAASAAPGSSPYMQVNAWFGDGFRTTNPDGSPFSWNVNTGAQFNLDLKGSVVSASDSNLGNLGFGQVGAFILLSIYAPGTFSPDTKLVGDPQSIGYYLYLLGNPNQSLTYTDQQGQQHSLIPTAYYGDLSQDIHITQDFQPNGDFDWSILLGAGGQVFSSENYNIDLSHTLDVGYKGPDGSVTNSVSGLFDTAQAVPEPSGLVLVATGIAGVGILGRRSVPKRA